MSYSDQKEVVHAMGGSWRREPTKCGGVVRAVEMERVRNPKKKKRKKEGDLRETLDVARETMPTLHMYILMSYSRTSLTASIMISLIFM